MGEHMSKDTLLSICAFSTLSFGVKINDTFETPLSQLYGHIKKGKTKIVCIFVFNVPTLTISFRLVFYDHGLLEYTDWERENHGKIINRPVFSYPLLKGKCFF